MHKNDIADVLSEIGTLLELRGENVFKVRAYQSGARALEVLNEDLETVISEGRLKGIRGIGSALAKKIEILFETGELTLHQELVASVPHGLLEMLEIPGLGAKKIRVLTKELGIESIEGLAAACREGKVASLSGFGKRSQERVLSGIQNRETYGQRHLWWDAFALAQPILVGLRGLSAVVRAEHAGSLRRGLETVGDLDFIASSDHPDTVMDWFVSQDGVGEITAKGETKSSVRFMSGIQADLRVVPDAQFCFALHHFTGSKDHNVLMRQRALARGFSLGEWGLTPVDGQADLGPKEGAAAATGRYGSHDSSSISSEADLFDFLGLRFIPPELREGFDELVESERGPLPRLVQVGDLKGVFHNHTVASDGRNSLEEMAASAADLGWEYLGIADHSKASFQANGLDEERLAEQIAEIHALNSGGTLPTRLLAGVECDILPDGRLDLDDGILRQLDYVVVSVHSSFSQSEEAMTARIIRALEHPCCTILGHLTGRILLRREGYRVDAQKVIDAAKANGRVIELNADPHRLDMDWRLWKKAAQNGVLCAINPDAHRSESLNFVEAGIRIARKGWLTPENVLNTRSLHEIVAFLGR